MSKDIMSSSAERSFNKDSEHQPSNSRDALLISGFRQTPAVILSERHVFHCFWKDNTLPR
jgi:hypothetical protein